MKTQLNVFTGLALFSLLTLPALAQVATVDDSPEEFRVSGNVHVPNVTIKGLPGNVKTDSSGRYVATVPYNWTGTITPEKRGMTFRPASKQLHQVNGNVMGIDFEVVEMNTRMISSNPEVLVVPTTEVKPSQFAAIQQDMRVMSHILKKAVQDEKNQLVGGVFSHYGSLLGRNDQSLRSLYIQGYGALFFIQAGIPLEWSSEPVLAVGPEDEDEQSADPVWQQARNQVFNPAAQATQSRSSRRDTEALMRKLMDGLKHAANIRYMAPEERVVVTVLSGSELPVVYGMAGGGASGMGGYYRETYGTGTDFASGDAMGMYGESGGDPYGASRTPEGYGAGRSSGFSASSRPKASQAGPKSTLTLLVSKAQIDAFAQGQMKLNDFIKRVQVIKY